MSKLPAISGKNLVRALQKGGFVVKRQSGSHVIMEHIKEDRMTVVPVHGNKDLPTGTLRGILKDVEISDDQLREWL